MLNIGITGQVGFIGTHLYNSLALSSEKYNLIEFRDEYFDSSEQIDAFVKQCDVVVHLAAINRHKDQEVIYNTNIDLVTKLVSSLKNTKSTPHVLFASSTQEEKDNLYGKSKREGRKLLECWAKENNASFSGLIIPNVFGPFGNPYYNSVVATFCHQLTHGEKPRIEIDDEIKLIFISDLIVIIRDKIDAVNNTDNGQCVETFKIPFTSSIKVSNLLMKLVYIKESYLDNGIFPNLSDDFTLNIFNTFICYIDHATHFPFSLKKFSDIRGSFVETIKLNSGGQVSFSTTVPGITRGNHFHTRKVERFVIIKGKARIEIRRVGTDIKHTFILDGDQPSFVDIPIWYTHNITNISDEELYTIFWINEEFNPTDPDTYYEEVQKNNEI